MNGNESESVINITKLFRVLLKKWMIIVSAGVLCAVLMYVYSSYFVTPMYESSTKVYVYSRENEDTITYGDIQVETELTKDYLELVQSGSVLQQVADDLQLPISGSALKKHIKISTSEDTRIIEIKVSYKDPVLACKIADELREVSGEHIQNVMGVKSLTTAEAAEVASEPASPNILLNTLLGGFAGVFLSCFFILLAYTRNDKVRWKEDAEKYLGVECLAVIPTSKELKVNKNLKEQGTAKSIKTKKEVLNSSMQ